MRVLPWIKEKESHLSDNMLLSQLNRECSVPVLSKHMQFVGKLLQRGKDGMLSKREASLDYCLICPFDLVCT